MTPAERASLAERVRAERAATVHELRCHSCNLEKPDAQFPRKAAAKNRRGRAYECKACGKLRDRAQHLRLLYTLEAADRMASALESIVEARVLPGQCECAECHHLRAQASARAVLDVMHWEDGS